MFQHESDHTGGGARESGPLVRLDVAHQLLDVVVVGQVGQCVHQHLHRGVHEVLALHLLQEVVFVGFRPALQYLHLS